MREYQRQIVLHVLASLAFLSLPLLSEVFSDRHEDGFAFSYWMMRDLLGYTLALAYFYLNFLVLVPRFYFSRQYGWFLLCTLLCFAVIVMLPEILLKFPEPTGFRPPGPLRGPKHGKLWWHIMSHHFLRFVLAFFIALLLRISLRLRQTEQERTQSELSFLKAQINPHFLFNTLNTIYSLAIQQSEDTAAAVVKLSGMMRYITSESQQDQVSIEKELDYIRNYVDLQRIRFGDTVAVNFIITDIHPTQQIAPLILIPFIENAFKHGVNPEAHSSIRIHLYIQEGVLNMEVQNNKVPVQAGSESSTGLGIQNTRNRLELLYPGRFELQVKDTEQQFTVHLSIQLQL